MPLRAAESAVTCPAKGVDLREPLKPAPPADSQAITLPSLSVSETIVLLKLVLMCAWPKGMFLRTRRRPLRPLPPRCWAITQPPFGLRARRRPGQPAEVERWRSRSLLDLLL